MKNASAEVSNVAANHTALTDRETLLDITVKRQKSPVTTVALAYFCMRFDDGFGFKGDRPNLSDPQAKVCLLQIA